MYLKSLSIRDLRSYDNADVQFSENINIIVGHNNSGKSTLIKAIYGLQDINVFGPNDIRLDRYFAIISIQLSGIDQISNDRYFNMKYPLAKDFIETSVDFKIMHKTQEVKYVYSVPLDLSNDVAKKIDKLYGLESIKVSGRDFYGFPNAENLNNFIYPFFAKRKIANYQIKGSAVNAYSVLDNFQNLPAKVQKVASQPSTKKLYDQLCEDILGFTVTAIASENGTELNLGIYSGYKSMIRIESMGEGVVNIIGLITILLTENGKLFLIEELENDIHPVALKKLLNLIIEKSKDNQFVISTHSNIVLKYLGSLPKTKIYYTESSPRDDLGNDIPTSKVTEIENSTVARMQVLESLGYDLFDYDLFKGYIIFEESSAERIIRDYLITFFLPADAKLMIRTIAAQGVSDLEPKFNDLNRLFLYLHLSPVYDDKSWVIADGDESGLKAISDLKLKYKNSEDSHFLNFTKPIFEDYYPEQFKSKVDILRSMPSSIKKQQLKTEVLNEVIAWIDGEPEGAKPILEESAREVICILRTIYRSLK